MKYNYLILSAALVAGVCGNSEAAMYRMKATSTELAKPVVKPATEIANGGFTANWEPVADADYYCTYVYEKTEIQKDGDYTIIAEDFDNITMGSVIEPEWSDEMYVSLDDYTSLPNWTVNGYASYAGGMVGGLVYSPYLDLRNNDGKFSVNLTYYASKGDEIRVYAFNENNESVYKTYICENQGDNNFTVDFDNGWKASFFYVVSMATDPAAPAYLDDVTVTQHLKKGDVVYTNVALNESLETNSWKISAQDLRFSLNPDVLYYDVEAVKVDVSGSRPVYSYSPFSDMQEVQLFQGGVEAAASDSYRAYGVDGAIAVVAATDAQVEVYNAAGTQLVNETVAAGSSNLPLAPGLYIVKLNNTTTKVIVK